MDKNAIDYSSITVILQKDYRAVGNPFLIFGGKRNVEMASMAIVWVIGFYIAVSRALHVRPFFVDGSR